MNKINKALLNLCPDGAGYKTLGELEDANILTLGRGKIISKKEMIENPGDYPVFSSSVTGDGEIGKYGEYMFDDERITWSIDGGGKLFYRNNIKYSVTNVGGYIKVLSSDLSCKYLYYVLINQWKTKKFDYVKKAHPSVIRDEYIIPIVPLKIQNEIVNILDKLSEIIDVLNKELTLRYIQYDYYKDYITKAKSENETCNLAEVCDIIDCPHSSPKWQTNGIPVIRNYNLVNGNIDTSNLSYVSKEEYIIRTKRVEPKYNDILFSREAPIGNVGIVPENFMCCQGQRVVLLRPNSNIVRPRYLLHILQGNFVKEQIKKVEKIGSTVSNFNISDLKKLKINVPSLEKQDEVIRKLDIFHDFCSVPNEALPAEIKAREKMMDYYMEKILKFEIKEV